MRDVERLRQHSAARAQVTQSQRPDRGHELACQNDPESPHRIGRRPRGLRPEPGMLLGTDRQHRAAEYGRGSQTADVSQGRMRRVLNHHQARARRYIHGKKRGQAGNAVIEQRAEPGSRQGCGLEHGGARRVQRQRQIGGVEIAVVPDPLPGHVDQRILGSGVQLAGDHALGVSERVDCGPVHLRQRPEPVRILHPGRGLRLPGQQPAHVSRDENLARMGAGQLHCFGIGLCRCAGRDVTECRDHGAAREEAGQVCARDCGFGERRRVTRHKGKHVGRVEGEAWRRDYAGVLRRAVAYGRKPVSLT